VSEPVPALDTPGVAPEAENVVRWALAKDADERPSAVELAAALRGLVASAPAVTVA